MKDIVTGLGAAVLANVHIIMTVEREIQSTGCVMGTYTARPGAGASAHAPKIRSAKMDCIGAVTDTSTTRCGAAVSINAQTTFPVPKMDAKLPNIGNVRASKSIKLGVNARIVVRGIST